MASDIRRIIWSTRERLISDDLQNATALQHRALIEALAATVHGDTAKFGVVRGMVVSIPGGDLTVSVSAGLALRSGSAPTTYDSTTEWVEIRTAQSVNLASFVDGTNPRWVAIEIADADAVEAVSLRDVFQPATGTFLPSSLDKVKGSSPTLSVTAGTAAATPQLPAGTAGRIPLAYVYIPAAAATLTVGDVVHSRPLLRAPGMLDVFDELQRIAGGGVVVSSDGTTITLRECHGWFRDHTFPFRVIGNSTFAVAAGGFDGGSLPGADTPVYFYAVPAPYPAGYDASLAAREFRPETSAQTRFPGLVPVAVNGCLVVASTTAPTTTTISGAPGAGSFSITAAPWGGSASVVRSRGVYLGAAFYDQSSAVFRAQTHKGAALVTPAAGLKPSLDLKPGGTFLVAPTTGSIWGLAGGTFMYPTTALRVYGTLRWAALGGYTGWTVELRDDVSDGVAGGGNNPLKRLEFAGAANQANGEYNHPMVIHPSSTGLITVQALSEATGGTVTPVIVYADAYEDAVLARR